MTATVRHWLKFNAVGIAGVAVQLIVLALLKSGLGFDYLLATLLAVEATILHNFYWHERWTWVDRTRDSKGILVRLIRFNLSNGIVSIAGNIGLMWLLVSRAHIGYVVANLAAIVVCSLINFFVSDRLVFRSVQ